MKANRLPQARNCCSTLMSEKVAMRSSYGAATSLEEGLSTEDH